MSKENRANFIATIKELRNQGYKYIILADTDHTSIEINELAVDEQVLAAIKESGISLIVPEGSIEQNDTLKVIDNIRAGNKDRYTEFKKHIYSMAEEISSYHANNKGKAEAHGKSKVDMFIRPGEFNIKVKYVDEAYDDKSITPELIKAFERLSGVVTNSECGEIQKETLLNSEPELRKYEQDIIDSLKFRVRTATNKTIADNIKSEGKDALVTYGAGHVLQKQDIDEFLGSDITATIVLFPSPESKIVGMDKTEEELGIELNDLPQYLYNISNDEMVKIEANTPSEKIYLERRNGTLTSEEHQNCIDELPDNLKKLAPLYGELQEAIHVEEEQSGDLPSPLNIKDNTPNRFNAI